jgi:hypothetical protein
MLLGINCNAFLLDDDSVTNLLALLQTEKEARGQLESAIVSLRGDIAKANSKHQSCK